MWRFTMLWSVIIIGTIHLACGVVGGLVFARKHPLVALAIPVVAVGIGMLMAFISSSIVGTYTIGQVAADRPGGRSPISVGEKRRPQS